MQHYGASWITRALSPSIAQSIIWIDKKVDAWNDLKDKFYQGDIVRIFDLQEEIFAFKHGELSIIEYFTPLKILWDELINFRPIPSSSCTTPCSYGALESVRTYVKNDYVIKFLKRLNDQFSNVKSQIMMMVPLPNVNKVFSLVL